MYMNAQDQGWHHYPLENNKNGEVDFPGLLEVPLPFGGVLQLRLIVQAKQSNACQHHKEQ